jgi:hypothetical protein
MTSTSAAVEENAAAAAEMRSTTDHVTNVIIPIAATASANAATAQNAAAATQELASGMSGIENTARSLRDRAAELELLLARFNVNEKIEPRKYRRGHVDLAVTYCANGRPATAARARDIGGGGICIATREPIPASALPTVRFELPGSGPMEAVGRIVATEFDSANSVYVHNLAFTEITDSTRASIVDFVDQARRELIMA